MNTIEQIALHAVAVYAEYIAKGFGPEDARRRAVREVLECCEDVTLVKKYSIV